MKTNSVFVITDDDRRFNFGGQFIYKDIVKSHLERAIPCIQIKHPVAIDSFNKWAEK